MAPAIVAVSERHAGLLDRVACGRAVRIPLGPDHEARFAEEAATR